MKAAGCPLSAWTLLAASIRPVAAAEFTDAVKSPRAAAIARDDKAPTPEVTEPLGEPKRESRAPIAAPAQPSDAMFVTTTIWSLTGHPATVNADGAATKIVVVAAPRESCATASRPMASNPSNDINRTRR
ncbi:exported hypothetical protein [Bradyrhizobium sp. STM 3809]|nr:exported hypothetical protein [Bradyrhizobium sp. STM 3809]